MSRVIQSRPEKLHQFVIEQILSLKKNPKPTDSKATVLIKPPTVTNNSWSDDYLVEHTIGNGMFGRVKLGTHLKSNTPCVIEVQAAYFFRR